MRPRHTRAQHNHAPYSPYAAAACGSREEKQLLQRYARQLDEQENRLEALRQDITRAEAQVASAREALSALIAGLSFDLQGE